MWLEVVGFDDLEVDEMDVHGVAEGVAVNHEPVLRRTDDGVLTVAFMEIKPTIDGVCTCYTHKRPVTSHGNLRIRFFAEIFICHPFGQVDIVDASPVVQIFFGRSCQ